MMNQTVRAIERALAILTSFDAEHSQLGITELSQRLQMPKSTVHRILTTLESWGFVGQDKASGRYQLGLQVFELGTVVGNTLALRQASLPVLEQLRRETQETVLLAVYDDGEVLYLDVLDSPQPVKLIVRPGSRLLAHCTASGKAFLSALPEAEVERLLSRPLIRRTPKTITDPDELRREMALDRQRGYSVAREENNPGTHAVGVPILSERGDVLGVVTVAGPAYRLSDEVMLHLAERTVAAAQHISQRIRGHNGAAE